MKSRTVVLPALLLIVFFVLTPIPPMTAGATPPFSPDAVRFWYVEPAGDGSLPCLASDPCNFNTAYVASMAQDLIIMRYGTYYQADMGYSIPYPTSMISLESKTTHLFGSWDGDPTATIYPVFNPVIHPSIINGSNTYRPITITGVDNTSLIYGFRITAGLGESALNTLACNGFGASAEPRCGGGIYVDGASPIIQSNQIWLNYAVATGDPETGLGGGIFAGGSEAIKIVNNDIYANSATGSGNSGYGGGIYLHDCGSETEVTNNTIRYNSAADDPYTGWGAGMVVEGSQGVEITGNVFSFNNMDGIIDMLGTALRASTSVLDILDNQFLDNQNGYILHLYSSAATIQRNNINNPEGNYGIGIRGGATLGQTTVINNFIVNHDWGNIHLLGIADDQTNVALYYNTVASFLGGDSTNGIIIGDYVDMFFTHGIVSNHWRGFKNSGHTTGDITIDYNLMYSNDLSNYDGFTATNTISGDPKFINTNNTSTADFHIQFLSAGMNSGPGFGGMNRDIDYQARPNPPTGMMEGNDLGADEWWGWFLPMIKK